MNDIIPVNVFEVNQNENFNITELMVSIIISEDHSNKLLDGSILKLRGSNKYILLKLAQITNTDSVKITPDIPAKWDEEHNAKVNIKNGIRIEGVIEECTITDSKEEVAKEVL